MNRILIGILSVFLLVANKSEGQTLLGDGSFESLSGVATDNFFNGDVSSGGSGWYPLSFSPDSWVSPVPYIPSMWNVADGTPSSPDGGVFVAGLYNLTPGVSENRESFGTNVTDLEPGKTYIVCFYQCNAGEDHELPLEPDNKAKWEVRFGAEVQYSPPISYLGPGNQEWYYVELEFTATATSQELEFKAHNDGTNAAIPYLGKYREYMAVDGIEVKPACDSLIVSATSTELCFGEELTLTTISENGGVITWDGGAMEGVPFTPPVGTTTYTPTSSHINDCEHEGLEITVHVLPTVTASADAIEVCEGDFVTLAGGGASSYIWDGGVIDGVAFAPAAGTTTYTVTGTDEYGCENTANIYITANPLPIINAGPDMAVCFGESVILNGTGAGPGGTYTWDGEVTNGVSFTPGATTTYTVTGTTTDGCLNSDEVIVVVHELPDVIFTADDLEGCVPHEVNFTSLTPGATFDWEFGDGHFTDGGGVSHTYTESGLFDVSLTVISAEGCENSVTYNSYITVVEQPVAAFTYSPYEINVVDTRVSFTNESSFADTYEWNFGDGTELTEVENPDHVFPVEGNMEYWVILTAKSNYGCEDVTQQLITIKDQLIFYVPNAFTPDGDEFNGTFKPVMTSGYDVYDYHLTIFNRWGEVLFESYNPEYGWDGTYREGELVQDGVYIWQIEFKETGSDKREMIQGHVSLVR